MKKNKNGALKLWLILWFITPAVFYFRNKLMIGNTDGILGGLLASLLIAGIPYLIVALLVWFILKAVYRSISDGKELQPKHAILTWLVIFLILFSLPLFRSKQSSNQPQISNEYAESLPIFEAVNNARAKKGLITLQVNEKLCAYAKRRALQYQEKVVVPGGKDFEPLPLENDPEVEKTYFAAFPESTESVLRIGIQSSKSIAEAFTEDANKGAARLDLAHGCIAEAPTANGTGTWTVFIGGVAK